MSWFYEVVLRKFLMAPLCLGYFGRRLSRGKIVASTP